MNSFFLQQQKMDQVLEIFNTKKHEVFDADMSIQEYENAKKERFLAVKPFILNKDNIMEFGPYHEQFCKRRESKGQRFLIGYDLSECVSFDINFVDAIKATHDHLSSFYQDLGICAFLYIPDNPVLCNCANMLLQFHNTTVKTYIISEEKNLWDKVLQQINGL
jgi:hypothetical protein